MDKKALKNCYKLNHEKRLSHRYICNDHILPILENLDPFFKSNEIGRSVNNESIYSIQFGSGDIKILMWSQMHGNESTTTKALFDLFSCISHDKISFKNILEQCTITIIPILNPDGARLYTRENANGVDLNRDAKNLSQPESKILRKLFNDLQPDICFNLHGQRTIYSVTDDINSAILSFLAPAQDLQRSITSTRKTAMSIIAAIGNHLKKELPNQIGRYDDTFNSNCVGDTFQGLGVPTILFEAGHYPEDYSREITRQYIFEALIVGLQAISGVIERPSYKEYFNIPENEKNFYDVIIRNVKNENKLSSIAIQYQERLIDRKIEFIPQVIDLNVEDKFKGHLEIDAVGNVVETLNSESIFIGYENDFVLINNEKYALKA